MYVCVCCVSLSTDINTKTKNQIDRNIQSIVCIQCSFIIIIIIIMDLLYGQVLFKLFHNLWTGPVESHLNWIIFCVSVLCRTVRGLFDFLDIFFFFVFLLSSSQLCYCDIVNGMCLA